jgi:hypothetical protein
MLCVIFTLVDVFLTIVTESYTMARMEMFGDSVQGSETIKKHRSHLLTYSVSCGLSAAPAPLERP